MSEPLFLGIDLGSSSTRAFVYDQAGVSVAGARVRYRWMTTADGGVEADPDHLVDLTASAIDQALAACGSRRRSIAAAGISTFWHGLVGIDGDRAAVTPLFSWSDTRATADAAALRAELDAAVVHARTGCALHPSYDPARLRWLARTRRPQFDAARCWLSAGDFLVLRLFGRLQASVSMASASGLFDQTALAWDADLVDHLPVDPSALPAVAGDEPLEGLAEPWASRWPELASIPWARPAGDGASANLGSGCHSVDSVALSLGTSGAMRVVLDAPRVVIPDDLWCYRIDTRRFILGGAISNGGNVYRWMREVLALPGEAEVEQELARREPASHRLTALPFFGGERSPEWPLDARAAFAGLTLDTDAIDLLHASMEAVAYRLALIYRPIVASFGVPARIVASGRALAASRAWAQIMCDVLARPLLLSAIEESSSRGAALLAANAIGAVGTFPDPPEEVLHPDDRRHAIHTVAMQRYLEMNQVLAERGYFSPSAQRSSLSTQRL